MRIHLYDFDKGRMLLSCACGWSKKLMSSEPHEILSQFNEHCGQLGDEAARAAR